MNLHGKNILGGSLSAEGTRTFQGVDPKTGQNLEPVYTDATEKEIDRALVLAEDCFARFRATDPEERADFLEAVAGQVEALGEDLINRAMAETGLPEARLVGERARTTGQLRAFASLVREGSWIEARIDTAQPDRQPLPKPDLRRMLIPLGPCVVFGASNFPLAFSAAGGDSASALAAGCPVVLKAHPAHPGTSEMVADAFQRAVKETGMPEGVFSMIHGIGHEVSRSLVTHPYTQAVGFTGSLRAGRALFDAAASRPQPIPVYAEMGSINPVFLLPGVLKHRLEEFCQGYLGSLTLGVGQFCTNPGLLVIRQGPGLEELKTRLAQLVENSPCGTLLYAGIREAYEKGLERFRGFAGVSSLSRSKTEANPDRTEASSALFSVPASVFLGNPDLSEEVFGPCGLLVECETREEMLTVARNLAGNLTATIQGTEEDLAASEDLVALLERKVGRLLFNGFPTGVEVCPSMQHGGPYPATTDSRVTSVGTAAILRFARPVCFQNFPQERLPAELRDDNPRGIWRLVNGSLTRDAM
jgi:NADP-dependent aldehyde dehydrogenase